MTNNETISHDALRDCTSFRKAAYDLTKDGHLMRNNVARCISIMNSNSYDLEVQNGGTLALGALCDKRHLEDFIGECGGMEALLVSIKRFARNERVVKNILVVLRSLLVSSPNRERFRIHGGLNLLVSTMKIHPKRAAIQRVSCCLVGMLSCESECRRFKIVESGVLPLILKVLTRFERVRDSRVLLHACMVIRNLTTHPNQCEQVIHADCEISGISNVILKTADREAVYSALCVFRNVMAHHGIVSFPLVTKRKITETLLAFLNRSSLEPIKYGKCHEVTFSLLRSRLLRKDNFISEDQFLKQCLSYTTKYLQKEETQEDAVVGHTCACIRMLLFDERKRVNFRDIPNSIETLVQAISVLSSRPIRVEQALLALGNAVFDSEQAQGRAEAEDGIRTIADTMKENHFSAPVTIAGLEAIHAICAKNYRTVETATLLSLQVLCVKSLQVFKDNPNVQEPGLATMVTLGQTVNGVQALRRVSALRAGRRACKQFPFSKKILLLTERIQGLVDGEIPVFDDEGNTVENATRPNIASRLLRKLSSRSNAQE